MRRSTIILNLAAGLVLSAVPALSQTNLTGQAGGIILTTNIQVQEVQARLLDQRAEQMRTNCISGSRQICGKVLQNLPEGLVIDSGYTSLVDPHFNKSWRVPGTVSVTRDPALVEANTPGAPCIGLVFLTDIPKRPLVKLYDYVTIRGYPAGIYNYAPLPGIEKNIRKFAARLPTAVRLSLQADEKTSLPPIQNTTDTRLIKSSPR